MKTLFKTVLVLGLVMVLASLALGVAAIGFLSDVPGVHLSINGDDVMWSSLDLGSAFSAGVALVITIGVLCLVVPLVLLLGLGLPLLILGGVFLVGVAAVLGLGAVLGSPVLLIALVVWLLVRDKPRAKPVVMQPPPAPPTGPTMTA